MRLCTESELQRAPLSNSQGEADSHAQTSVDAQAVI